MSLLDLAVYVAASMLVLLIFISSCLALVSSVWIIWSFFQIT